MPRTEGERLFEDTDSDMGMYRTITRAENWPSIMLDHIRSWEPLEKPQHT